MAILFTLRVFTRNLLRGNSRRNTFCILCWCLAWPFTIEHNLSSLVLQRKVESKSTWCILYVYVFYAFSSCHKQLHWFYFFGIRMYFAWNVWFGLSVLIWKLLLRQWKNNFSLTIFNSSQTKILANKMMMDLITTMLVLQINKKCI